MQMRYVRIGGGKVNYVGVADGMAVLAEHQDGLQISVKILEEASKIYGI